MPLLRHDLTRAARRGRQPLLRGVYALALLAALGTVYGRQFPAFAAEPLDARAAASFAAACAAAFAWVQLVAVFVLAPALAAGAISEERARGTLDLLLTTGLRPGQIVRGKLLARVVQLLSVLAVGLPMLALAQLLGGVAPHYLAGSFALCAGFATSLAALGVACSARAKSVPAALATTYFLATVALLASALVPLTWYANPARVLLDYALTPPDAWLTAAFVCAGLHVAVAVVLAWAGGRLVRPGHDARERIAVAAARLAKRPGLVAAAFELLRRPVPTPVPTAKEVRAFPVPPPGRDALLWKELHFGGSALTGELVRSIGCMLVIIQAFVTLGVIAFAVVRPDEDLPRDVRELLRGSLFLALGATVVAVAAFAAGSLGRERERGTLDGLLTLPGGREAILWAKWRGAVLRGRWPAAVAAVTLGLGMATGAFAPGGALLLAVAFAAQVAFFASLGVWLSAATSGPGRAVVATAVVGVALFVAPTVAVDPLRLSPAAAWGPLRGMIDGGGLSPVRVWSRLAVEKSDSMSSERYAGFGLATVLYAAAAPLLFGLAWRRFRREADGWSGSRS